MHNQCVLWDQLIFSVLATVAFYQLMTVLFSFPSKFNSLLVGCTVHSKLLGLKALGQLCVLASCCQRQSYRENSLSYVIIWKCNSIQLVNILIYLFKSCYYELVAHNKVYYDKHDKFCVKSRITALIYVYFEQ